MFSLLLSDKWSDHRIFIYNIAFMERIYSYIPKFAFNTAAMKANIRFFALRHRSRKNNADFVVTSYCGAVKEIDVYLLIFYMFELMEEIP